jgi:hypothetical protein
MTTIYWMTAGLDGFPVDEDGSLDWLFEVPPDIDPHHEAGACFGNVGAYSMGVATYRMRHNLGVLEDRKSGVVIPGHSM